MERLTRKERTGLDSDGLRTWGLLFLGFGILGRGLLQNGLLGMAESTSEQLLDTLMNSSNGMVVATFALIFQLLEACATPIFCFLLVEGFTCTTDFGAYLKRVLGLAVVSELPYNFAVTGKLLDLGSRNPVFAMALGLVLLYFYKLYAERSLANFLIKLCVTVAALIWGTMLSIEGGVCCVLLTAVLWAFRKKPVYRNIMGCTASILCTLYSPFYLASPMSFLIIHFYNGEKGDRSRIMNYLAYPAMLVIVGIVSKILL